MALRIINVDTPTPGDRGYIAHDGKDALVVDPQRDIDRFEKILIERGQEILPLREHRLPYFHCFFILTAFILSLFQLSSKEH